MSKISNADLLKAITNNTKIKNQDPVLWAIKHHRMVVDKGKSLDHRGLIEI